MPWDPNDYNTWDPDEPGFKQWMRGSGSGGGRTIGNDPPPSPIGGLAGGGGSIGGSPTGLPSGSELRALIRKRYLGSPAAQASMQPSTGLTASLPSSEDGGPVRAAAPTMDSSMISSLMPRGNRGLGTMRDMYPKPTPQPGSAPEGDMTDREYSDPRVAPFVGLDLLIEFLRAGMLGPNPSPAQIESIKSTARDEAGAARDRQRLTAEALGADRATSASYGLQSDLRGQSDVSKAVTGAVRNKYDERENFARLLLQMMMGGVYGERQATAGSGGGGSDIGSILQGIGGMIAPIKLQP